MKAAASITLAALLAAAAAAGGYWLGTRSPGTAAPSAAHGSTTPGKKLLYYRNPMGLPDTSPVPKKDPMGMDYIAVYEGEEPQNVPPGTVRIAADKVQLLGVRTEAAQPRELKRVVHAVGTIQPNERLLYKVAPRFEGWIERLRVNTTGQAVRRGEALMDVYSPELVAAQEEYLIALRGEGELFGRLAESALRRLRNWEISDRELERLRESGQPQRVLSYRSPANGVVLAKPSVAGMRFMPGEALYEIADLSSVWMIADVAEQDLGAVRQGDEASVRIVAYPGQAFGGKVVFVYPTLEAATRTARVRIELGNPKGILKPAMYGDAEFAARASQPVLAVPDSAVLDSGARQVVLVRRGEGLFEPREVKVGLRAGGHVEVKEGLQPGEEVVVRANFLIDAESNLKAALGGFSAPAAAAQLHRGTGKVLAVDRKDGSVELAHDPIASLQWPAMNMAFKAKEPSMLAPLEPGQAVEFDLSQQAPGEFVIERIVPRGKAGGG